MTLLNVMLKLNLKNNQHFSYKVNTVHITLHIYNFIQTVLMNCDSLYYNVLYFYVLGRDNITDSENRYRTIFTNIFLKVLTQGKLNFKIRNTVSSLRVTDLKIS